MKSFKGKVPSTDDGWKLYKQFNLNDLSWSLYIKKQEHSKSWVTCKYIADGKALAKANYWFSFNMAEKRFAFARDLMIMKTNIPDMYEQVCAYLLDDLILE